MQISPRFPPVLTSLRPKKSSSDKQNTGDIFHVFLETYLIFLHQFEASIYVENAKTLVLLSEQAAKMAV